MNLIKPFLVTTVWLILFAAISLAQPPQSQIAFTANLNDNWDIFIMDADGTNIRQLTDTPFDERSPAISPNGERIIYASSDGKLGITDIQSRKSRALDLPEETYNHPAWLPDGGGLLFTYYNFIGSENMEDGDLWIYDLSDNTIDQTLKQAGNQVYPACAENGKIIYSLLISGPKLQISHQLWAYDPDAEKARQLLLGHFNDIHPDVSANGEKIVFASDRSGNYDLWLTDSKGTSLEQLTHDQASDFSPAFSTDETQILFTSNRSGRHELWRMNLKTGAAEKLSPFDEPIEIRDPSWR